MVYIHYHLVCRDYIKNFLHIDYMIPAEVYKQLDSNIRTKKCTNKGCLSGGNDNVEVVWFGKQYEEKLITCSSCYIMNDQAVKKSVPTSQNIVPISVFLNKFILEAKTYEQNKNSAKWFPSDLKHIQKEHLAEIDNFQCKLNGTLKVLCDALQNFTKKVVAANQSIYNNTVFNQIISLNTNDQLEKSLQKMGILIKYLNIGQDGNYRFQDIKIRDKKVEKLAAKIDEITKKILSNLDELLKDIQQKNVNIGKI